MHNSSTQAAKSNSPLDAESVSYASLLGTHSAGEKETVNHAYSENLVWNKAFRINGEFIMSNRFFGEK